MDPTWEILGNFEEIDFLGPRAQKTTKNVKKIEILKKNSKSVRGDFHTKIWILNFLNPKNGNFGEIKS